MKFLSISTGLILLAHIIFASQLQAGLDTETPRYHWQQTLTLSTGISMEDIKKQVTALQEEIKEIDGIKIIWVEYRQPEQSDLHMYEALVHCNLKTKEDIKKLEAAQFRSLFRVYPSGNLDNQKEP